MLQLDSVSKQLPSSKLCKNCTCFCLPQLHAGMYSRRCWKVLNDHSLFQSGWVKLVGLHVLMRSTVWSRATMCTLKFCNRLLEIRCRRRLLKLKLTLSLRLWRSWKQVFWQHFGAVFWREQTGRVSWDLHWVSSSLWVSLSERYVRKRSLMSLLNWERNCLKLYSLLRNGKSTSHEQQMTKVLRVSLCPAQKNSEYPLSWWLLTLFFSIWTRESPQTHQICSSVNTDSKETKQPISLEHWKWCTSGVSLFRIYWHVQLS